METDNETWLVEEEGNRIIIKKSQSDYQLLTNLEKAIYCFWWIDYSVRNSGTLQEVRKELISELLVFAQSNNCINLYSMLRNAENEEVFCTDYIKKFDVA